MDIEHDDEFVSDVSEDNLFLRLNRPCKTTVLCLARPVIEVFLSERGVEAYFGKVISVWTCIDMNFEVYDKEERLIFLI